MSCCRTHNGPRTGFWQHSVPPLSHYSHWHSLYQGVSASTVQLYLNHTNKQTNKWDFKLPGMIRRSFQVVTDHRSKGSATEGTYFNPVPSNKHSNNENEKANSKKGIKRYLGPDISRPRWYVFVLMERMGYVGLWNVSCSMEQLLCQ